MREGTSEGWPPAIISTMGSPAQAGRVHLYPQHYTSPDVPVQDGSSLVTVI